MSVLMFLMSEDYSDACCAFWHVYVCEGPDMSHEVDIVNYSGKQNKHYTTVIPDCTREISVDNFSLDPLWLTSCKVWLHTYHILIFHDVGTNEQVSFIYTAQNQSK